MEANKLLGLRGLVLIMKQQPIARKYIEKKLVEHGICAIIDMKGDVIELGRGCKGYDIIWLEEMKPLRGTGWSILISHSELFGNSNKGSLLHFPHFSSSWAVVKNGEEVYYLPDRFPQTAPREKWQERALIRGSKRAPPQFSESVKIKGVESCYENWKDVAVYWFCEDDSFILRRLDTNEVYVSGSFTFEVEKRVRNPRVYWLQPYAVVRDALNEKASSNFIAVEMPYRSFSAVSAKGIEVYDDSDKIEVSVRGPAYLSYSRTPNFALLHRLRTLLELPKNVSEDIPTIEIDPPAAIVRKFELKSRGLSLDALLELSYPLDIPSALRIRIAPPFYIANYAINDNLTAEVRANDIEIPLLGIDFLTVKLEIRRKGGALRF